MSGLSLEGLSVRYAAAEVVHAVSLTVRRGEIVALLGESGSGKSTIALAALGLLPGGAEMSGRVLIDGVPFVATDRGRRLGMVFQDPATALNPALSIGRQIGEVGGLSRGEIVAALRDVGLDVAPSRYPHELSGGQRQRVALAIALAGRPELLIADEPTAALDPASRAEIATLLQRIVRERAIGLLLITHDLALAASLADRVTVLDQGALMEQGAGMPALAGVTRPPPAPPPPRDPAPLLTLEHVSHSYRTGWRSPAARVLDDVSLEVRTGETVALIGASGAGKSTLARIALGLERPQRGRVTLGGLDPHASGREVRRLAQAVFQDPATSFDPLHAVGRIVAEPLRLRNGPLDAHALVAGALVDVGLDPAMAARSPADLSGGQRQRVALARALVLQPRLIVLDEPLSALDARARGAMIDLLLRLQAEQGFAYLLIAHDMEVVQALAHRVVELRDGRITP